jgi:hypothetical protein
MRVKMIGKQTVEIRMTQKQLDALLAALDSVTSYGDADGSYADVFKVRRILLTKLEELEGQS